MKITEDQARVQELLKETITLLCKNGLNYKARFSVEALIGVTIDDSEVFLVNIKENIRNENAEPESSSEAETEPETKKSSNGTAKRTPGRKRPPDDGGKRYSDSSPLKRSRSNMDSDNDENDGDFGEDENDDGASNLSSTQTDMDSRTGVKREPGDEHDLVFVKQEQQDFFSATTSSPGSSQPSFTSQQPQPMSVFSHSGQQPPHDANLDMSQDSSWAMNQSASNLDPSNLASMSASQGGSNQVFACPVSDCHHVYRSRKNLRFHLRGVHGFGKPIECGTCGRQFKSDGPYYKHTKECKAKKMQVFSEFSKSFSSYVQKSSEEKRETRSKPVPHPLSIKLPALEKSQVQKPLLEFHQQQQLICPSHPFMAFKDKEQLVHHMRSVHNQAEPLVCNFCADTFKTESTYVKHFAKCPKFVPLLKSAIATNEQNEESQIGNKDPANKSETSVSKSVDNDESIDSSEGVKLPSPIITIKVEPSDEQESEQKTETLVNKYDKQNTETTNEESDPKNDADNSHEIVLSVGET